MKIKYGRRNQQTFKKKHTYLNISKLIITKNPDKLEQFDP